MPYKYGRDMGFTSNEVKKIYSSLKSGKYIKGIKFCNESGCRGGFRVNNLTNKLEECPKCKGYGFYREV